MTANKYWNPNFKKILFRFEIAENVPVLILTLAVPIVFGFLAYQKFYKEYRSYSSNPEPKKEFLNPAVSEAPMINEAHWIRDSLK